ncbi:MAG: VWA domain-containing protein [Pseudomonadota bacterium]
MQANLVNFIHLLRSHDVRVSPAESLDAMQVAAKLGYSDRRRLRDGLGMALAKTAEEEAMYLACFDRYFSQSLAGSESDAFSESPEDPGETIESETQAAGPEVRESQATDLLQAASRTDEGLAELLNSSLMQSLIDGDRNELSLSLSQAADSVGLGQMTLFTQRGQFTRRMLDAMGEEQIRAAVIRLEQAESPALNALQGYRDLLRQLVRDHVEREYLLHADGRNQQFMEDILRKTRLSNIESQYLQRVTQLVRKMARKLASRHARKRRTYKRGQLHMPRTLRKGVANDGVMFQTYWRRVRKDKPQILAVCDVSGSVAAYAKFLLLFLYSLQDVLPRVRSFAFSSHLGEVSNLFVEHDMEKAIEMINWRYGGATDYGRSLLDFSALAMDDINSNTTVIILGDARNNHGDPQLEVMRSIYQRARQVIWLNPESRRSWGTGDSDMPRYQSACHFAAECNSLQQLERIVDQLMRSTQ